MSAKLVFLVLPLCLLACKKLDSRPAGSKESEPSAKPREGVYAPKLENNHKACSIEEIGAMTFSKIEAKVEENFLKISVQTTNTHRNAGVRLYAVYLTAHPEKNGIYQPFQPKDVAWPKFFPEKQWFYEFNTEGGTSATEHIRDCARVDINESVCAHDDVPQSMELKRSDVDKEKMNESTIVFKETLSLLGLAAETSVQFAVNGWYRSQNRACELETDAPDWGNKTMFELSLMR